MYRVATLETLKSALGCVPRAYDSFQKIDMIDIWVVRKVRAAKDLNLINEIKNLNLLRFNFPSKSARTFQTTQYFQICNYLNF